MSKRRFGMFLAVGTLALVASDAQQVNAAKEGPRTTSQLQIMSGFAHGYNGVENNEDSYTNEHGYVVDYVTADGRQMLTTFHLTGKVSPALGPAQIACSSIEMTADGPKTIASNVLITSHTGGERNASRMAAVGHGIKSNQGEAAVAVYYGTDFEDGNDTNLYVTHVNEACETIIEFQRVSTANDNDNGGPTANLANVTYDPNDETKVTGFNHLATSFYNGGGGDVYIYHSETYVDENGDLQYGRISSDIIYSDVNIARHDFAVINDNKLVMVGPYGNDRPPSKGALAIVWDYVERTSLEEKLIYATNELEDIYPNDFKVFATHNPEDVMVKMSISNGAGENNNELKGSSTVRLASYRVTAGNELLELDTLEDVGMPSQTHGTMCTGYHDKIDSTNMTAAIVTAPPTGAGQAHMHFFDFGTETRITKRGDDERVISEVADSGHQSNIYGGNPNRQGRDLINCIGNVNNPGYGIEGGYMSHVKTFWAVMVAGKEPQYDKNSMFMLLPTATGDFDGSTTGPNDDDPETTGGGPDGGPAGGNNQAGACAVNSTPGAPAGTGLALLGLGLIVAGARRRREEV